MCVSVSRSVPSSLTQEHSLGPATMLDAPGLAGEGVLRELGVKAGSHIRKPVAAEE